jgi:uracil-DNA glycosylase family 4
VSEGPGRDCDRCPRLVEFRLTQRHLHSEWYNAPVPSFGAFDARLLIVGLAPGLKGANRTGRPFTGDFAGDLLYGTLAKFQFARGRYDARADDGFTLIDCRVTNAVRCVPPENKPEVTEIKSCNGYLAREIAAMPRLRIILALGAIAHGAILIGANRCINLPMARGTISAGVSPSPTATTAHATTPTRAC